MATGLLVQARKALAAGDLNSARQICDRVTAMNLQYGEFDDQPLRVVALINTYRQLKTDESLYSQDPQFRRSMSDMYLDQANAFLVYGQLDDAMKLANRAKLVGASYTDNPAASPDALIAVVQQRQQQTISDRNVRQVSTNVVDNSVNRQAYYNPQVDPTRNQLASTTGVERIPTPPGMPMPQQGYPISPVAYQNGTANGANTMQQNNAMPNGNTNPMPSPSDRQLYPQAVSPAMAAFQNGEAALKAFDSAAALEYYREAAKSMNEFDPATKQILQDRIQALSAPAPREPGNENMLDAATATEAVVLEKYRADISRQLTAARQQIDRDPRATLEMLQKTRASIESAEIDQVSKRYFLRQIDRGIANAQAYIEQNISDIQLDEENAAVLDEIAQYNAAILQRQQDLKDFTDEFNALLDENRIAEAVIVSKRAREMYPDEIVTNQMYHNANMIWRITSNRQIQEDQANGFLTQLQNVDIAAIGYDDNIPMQYGTDWQTIRNRQGFSEITGIQRSIDEKEIERKLKSVKVSLNYNNSTPFSEVIEYLRTVSQVNILIDTRSISQVGIQTDFPVTISLPNAISLESALKNILEPLRLGYIIKDDVLWIKNEQDSQGELVTVPYYVADLVIPIPNFGPNPNLGLSAMYRQAMVNAMLGGGGLPAVPQYGMSPNVLLAGTGGPSNAMIDQTVLAQIGNSMSTPLSGTGMPGMGGSPLNMGGPAGAGGPGGADFDSLIELIQNTISPESWKDVAGGPGTIEEYDGNLSLVIKQTEEVHNEIANLLQQLRKMQDLQVTIEVRFITLNDDYFERIGIDFDWEINDNVPAGLVVGNTNNTNNNTNNTNNNNNTQTAVDQDRSGRDSVTVGLALPDTFTADLDIPFKQDSFSHAVPQFGNYDPTAGIQTGFAILSEIEAFFFLQAAQGDTRNNVMQARRSRCSTVRWPRSRICRRRTLSRVRSRSSATLPLLSSRSSWFSPKARS